MSGILQSNEYVKCPNCSGMLRTFDPTCPKCGLSASEEGVLELAQIDSINGQSLADAQTLTLHATAPYPLFLIAWLFSEAIPEVSVSCIFFTAVYSGVFWWKLIVWQKHSTNEFPDERFDEARRIKNRAAFIGALASGIILIAFNVIFSRL